MNRLIVTLAVTLFAGGFSLILYAATLPVYMPPDAPDRIDQQISSLPVEEQFKRWDELLPQYETSHKRLSDFGRGLVAAGVALLAATGFWLTYHRQARMRTTHGVLAVWVALWVAQVPLVVWYYCLRESRFDYPADGDSIAIPIIEEWISVFLIAFVSTIILRLFLRGRIFPPKIEPGMPRHFIDWFRAAFVIGLGLLLAYGTCEGIAYGDEGAVLFGIMGPTILCAFFTLQAQADCLSR